MLDLLGHPAGDGLLPNLMIMSGLVSIYTSIGAGVCDMLDILGHPAGDGLLPQPHHHLPIPHKQKGILLAFEANDGKIICS